MVALALATLATGGQAHQGDEARVKLRDAAGNAVGKVELNPLRSGLVEVTVKVHDLSPGFHGFHVHAIGLCEALEGQGPFTAAGGHLNPGGASHPGHAGDMPVLYVTGGGKAKAQFVTDRLTADALFDEDGSAIIVHLKPDNYANIPTRYVAAPDAATLATGDAGDRVACGVVKERDHDRKGDGDHEGDKHDHK